MSKNKHLTRAERIIIEKGLSNGSSRKSIADTLGKSNSTVCKEVKLRSVNKRYHRAYMRKAGTYDCTRTKECGHNQFCPNECKDRQPIPCKRRDRKVGVCNGCETLHECKLTKRIYDAEEAESNYRYSLRDSREGINLTTSEAKKLGAILKDGTERGLSLYAIKKAHPEIRQSERTLYNYVEEGVFSASGLVNMDLPVKVRRKKFKTAKVKVRKDSSYLKGRTYKDFEQFMTAHRQLPYVEMDTCYNSNSDGPFIQTFQFVEYGLMIGIYHEEKTAHEMYLGVKMLKDWLGDSFDKVMPVILTDRGSEFTAAAEIESLGCRIFYCDPMASCQKPHVENNHLLFRRICPKQADLKKLGLTSQEMLNLVFSHVNSYPREEKHGKSPVEIFEFFHSGSDLLNRLNIKKIDLDKLQLKPSLLRTPIEK